MTIVLCIESTVWGPKGVSIQCAANTIMLHSCDVETVKTRRQQWWRKEKPRRKDGLIAWPERQMMLATRMIQYFPTKVAVWPKWTCFDRQN